VSLFATLPGPRSNLKRTLIYVEIAPALNDTKDTYREAERRYGSLNANLLEVISLKDLKMNTHDNC